MHPDRFARARVLMEQNRADLAIPEIAARLADSPDDPEGHILLAFCRHQAKRPEAWEAARRAVELAPDDPRAHFAVGLTETRRGNLDEAEAAVRRAIELNSWNAGYFGQLAAIAIARYRWADALRAADEGLALDPTDDVCLNNRAVALTKLGRHADAAHTLEGTLEEHPEDAFTHANRGWTLLHENEPRRAVEHFREALRLDPNSEWAKQGLLEALRARSWFYRRVLQVFLRLSRFSPRVQFGLLLGLVLLVQVLNSVGERVPAVAPVCDVLIFGYVAFVAATWFAKHITNVLLLFDRDGRRVLDRAEKWVSVICTGLLLLVLATVAVAVISRAAGFVHAAVLTFLTAFHFSSVMQIPAGRFRLIGAAVSVGVLGLFGWGKVERLKLLDELSGLQQRDVEFDQRANQFDNSDPELRARVIARNMQRAMDRAKKLPEQPDPPDPELDARDRRKQELLAERGRLDADFRLLKSQAEGLNTGESVLGFASIGGLFLHVYLASKARRVSRVE